MYQLPFLLYGAAVLLYECSKSIISVSWILPFSGACYQLQWMGKHMSIVRFEFSQRECECRWCDDMCFINGCDCFEGTYCLHFWGRRHKFWMHLLFFPCMLVPYPQNGKVFIIHGHSSILLFNNDLCSCYRTIKFKLGSVAGTVCKLGAWQVNSVEQKCVFGGGEMVT